MKNYLETGGLLSLVESCNNSVYTPSSSVAHFGKMIEDFRTMALETWSHICYRFCE